MKNTTRAAQETDLKLHESERIAADINRQLTYEGCVMLVERGLDS
jgi:hypothetical protein